MITDAILRAGLVPAAPRLPSLDVESAKTFLSMCRAHDIAPSLGGGALDPDHCDLRRSMRADTCAPTMAPARGAR